MAKKRYSVEEISPIPTGYKSDNKRKRKCKQSDVITASPMKDILCAKEAARTRRDAKGTETKKRLQAAQRATKPTAAIAKKSKDAKKTESKEEKEE